MKKKILIEGWRYINHSYALVNQFQIKELIKNKNLEIYFFDVPYFNPNWNKSDNHSGFDNYDFLKNLKKPNPNSNFDLIYRISYPPNLSGGNAKQIFVFGNSEFQNLDGIVDKKNIDNSKNINEKIKIIVPSNWSKKGFLSFGIPENKIFVIPHGVNQEIFKPISDSEKKKVRKEYNLSRNNFIFLNLGAMTWNKGVDKLILAFAITNKKFPHTKLILKDQSNLYNLKAENLIKTVQKKNSIIDKKVLSNILVISKNLSLNNLNLLYGASDAYVAPYRAEGFNLPPLEAASSGLPVILTDGGSTDDYFNKSFAIKIKSKVIKKDNNIFLEPDLENLIDIMSLLVEKKFHSFNFNKTQNFIKKNFSWSSIVKKLSLIMNF